MYLIANGFCSPPTTVLFLKSYPITHLHLCIRVILIAVIQKSNRITATIALQHENCLEPSITTRNIPSFNLWRSVEFKREALRRINASLLAFRSFVVRLLNSVSNLFEVLARILFTPFVTMERKFKNGG
jgi:hypothetical protein